MEHCETICDDCPFRRDSTRLVERDGWPDAGVWLGLHCWPQWKPPNCPVEGVTCLGWAVYIQNQQAHVMLPSTIGDWVDSWGEDEELIFSVNGEFVRYHRGEEHGGKGWFEDRISNAEPPSYDEKGQGILL